MCGNTETARMELTFKICKETEVLTQSPPSSTTIACLEAFLAEYDGNVLNPGSKAVKAD